MCFRFKNLLKSATQIYLMWLKKKKKSYITFKVCKYFIWSMIICWLFWCSVSGLFWKWKQRLPDPSWQEKYSIAMTLKARVLVLCLERKKPWLAKKHYRCHQQQLVFNAGTASALSASLFSTISFPIPILCSLFKILSV